MALHGRWDDFVKLPNFRNDEITIEVSTDQVSQEALDLILKKYTREQKKEEKAMPVKREPTYFMPGIDDEKSRGFSFKADDYVIRRVIFNDPATIVIWADGTKTVVKCGPHDEYDPEKGFVMCFMKRFFGNGNRFHKMLKIAHKEIDKQKKAEETAIKSFSEALNEAVNTLNKTFGI